MTYFTNNRKLGKVGSIHWKTLTWEIDMEKYLKHKAYCHLRICLEKQYVHTWVIGEGSMIYWGWGVGGTHVVKDT